MTLLPDLKINATVSEGISDFGFPKSKSKNPLGKEHKAEGIE
jgi:hypothetical protein